MSASASNNSSGASDGEIWDRCFALGLEGQTLNQRGDVPGAIAKYNEMLALSQGVQHEKQRQNIKSAAVGGLGNAYDSLGQYDKAIEHYNQALAISREIGDRQGEGSILGNLGSAYDSLGDYAKAVELHTQALAIARDEVMRHVDLMKRCRFSVVGVQPDHLPMLRAFDHLHRRDEDRSVVTMYVDAGWGAVKVAVARGTELVAVLLQAIDVGAVQHVLVRIRIVGMYALDEFKLTNHDNRPLYGDDCVHSTAIARIAG